MAWCSVKAQEQLTLTFCFPSWREQEWEVMFHWTTHIFSAFFVILHISLALYNVISIFADLRKWWGPWKIVSWWNFVKRIWNSH